jgi:demethylmenaquinone methyltransferase / 2-methoxy-6-polyprenyl-1,4-benzoquinol methylase
VSEITPYNTSTDKKEQVAEMFDHIAPKYDFLNQVLSFGIHKSWRRRTIKKLRALKPRVMMDVATGTGDLAIEAVKQLSPDKIIGVDISEGMMKFGREKVKQLKLDHIISFESGDSENLPFADNRFDAVTVGFGVRNFAHLQKGIDGMFRVLKPGGMLVVLEFSKPHKFPMKQGYAFYSRFILPLIGRMFSRDKRAYSYLPESIAAFPEGRKFLEVMKKAGFSDVSWQPLTFGIASIYVGKK